MKSQFSVVCAQCLLFGLTGCDLGIAHVLFVQWMCSASFRAKHNWAIQQGGHSEKDADDGQHDGSTEPA